MTLILCFDYLSLVIRSPLPDAQIAIENVAEDLDIETREVSQGRTLTYFQEKALQSQDRHRTLIWDRVLHHAELALEMGIMSTRARNESPDIRRICHGDHLDYCSPAPPGGKGGELALMESSQLGA